MRVRTFILLCLAACAGLPLVAQVRRPFVPEHYVGVRGGAMASWVNFSPAVEHTMRYSFMAGAVYRMVSEKFFGFQLEANYVQRGWKESVDGDPYERLTGYLEIPFMTHITFGSKVCKGFVNLGPSISVLLHENNVLSGSAYAQRTMKTANVIDYGITGGVGFEVHTVAGVYLLDARYSFGLGDIFPSSATDVFRTSSNQNIIVSLGWLFQVK